MKARDYRAQARAALKGKWIITTLIGLLAGILGAGSVSTTGGVPSLNLNLPMGGNAQAEPMMPGPAIPTEVMVLLFSVIGFIFLLAMAHQLFLGSYVRVGLVNTMDQLLSGERPQPGMLFPKGLYWRSVRMNLLRFLRIFLLSLLLVIPGVIASYRYSLADYLLLVHPEMGAREALQESSRRMKGRKWRLFCLELSFIGWGLLCAAPYLVMAGFFEGIASGNLVLGGLLLSYLALLPCGVGMLFLNSYMNAAYVAFFRDADRAACWQDEAAEGEAEAEQAYAQAEPVQPMPGAIYAQDVLAQKYGVHTPNDTALTADETVARDVFLQHKCSRSLLQAEDMLKAYLDLNPSPMAEEHWRREYADQLMRRFDREADLLDDLLALASEYMLDDLVNRVLQRIERHIRQQTLSDPEILNMCGRTLALLVSGRFDENPGFVTRKKEQVSDMADRLEHRLQESGDSSGWQEALALIRRMCM